jgi:hypothetical protein
MYFTPFPRSMFRLAKYQWQGQKPYSCSGGFVHYIAFIFVPLKECVVSCQSLPPILIFAGKTRPLGAVRLLNCRNVGDQRKNRYTIDFQNILATQASEYETATVFIKCEVEPEQQNAARHRRADSVGSKSARFGCWGGSGRLPEWGRCRMKSPLPRSDTGWIRNHEEKNCLSSQIVWRNSLGILIFLCSAYCCKAKRITNVS